MSVYWHKKIVLDKLFGARLALRLINFVATRLFQCIKYTSSLTFHFNDEGSYVKSM